MRTETINIYKFDELSEEAKRKALDEFEPFTDHIWQEVEPVIKKFHEIFGTKSGNRSWLDVRTGHIDDTILELKGSRLMAYLWNNYGSDLYKGKYRANIKGEVKHRRTKTWEVNSGPNKGNKYSSYYSGVFFEYSCPLTGMCYDHSLLDPLVKAMESPSSDTFGDVIEECFSNLKKDYEAELEYRQSDEAKTEDIEANEYEFTEDGERY